MTQATIGETICRVGWSRRVRPADRYTDAVKRRQIRLYGYADRNPRHYEEDHLIPIGLGGAPRSARNLWPEPRHPSDGWTAARKDRLEARLARLVCAGALSLHEARHAIRTDWHTAYRRYLGRR